MLVGGEKGKTMKMRKDTYLFNGEVVEIKDTPRVPLSLIAETFLAMLLRKKEVVEAIAGDYELSRFLEENRDLKVFLLGGVK